MKRANTFTLGMAIFIGGFAALLVASSVIKRVRAQQPEANVPAQQAPAAELFQNEPTAPESHDDLPPPPNEDMTMPEVSETPAANNLDASQDPGMKSLNPEGYVYDPTGRRDPFFPPMTLTPIIPPGAAGPSVPQAPQAQSPDSRDNVVSDDPLLTYYLRDYRLIGILWEVQDPKAMVRTPDNRVLTLHLKMKLGRENALVAAIRESELVVIEPDEKGEYRKGQVHRIRMNK